MIEYPSILNSSKAPRKPMIAFTKMDGSNIRIKWTPKKSFCLYGTRTQLIDATNPDFGVTVELFSPTAEKFDKMFNKEKIFRNLKEIIVFGEFFGDKSFAGKHYDTKDNLKVIPFDVMMVSKADRRFLRPQEFIELMDEYEIPRPEVVYQGNLTDGFIQSVRNEEFGKDLGEGVVCKGTEYVGNYAGHVWMCKIKTQRYLEKLKQVHGDKWKEFWE